jgi:hypothetical protein
MAAVFLVLARTFSAPAFLDRSIAVRDN